MVSVLSVAFRGSNAPIRFAPRLVGQLPPSTLPVFRCCAGTVHNHNALMLRRHVRGNCPPPFHQHCAGTMLNGTFDQGGSVWEWNESKHYGWGRRMRGGSLLEDVSNLSASVSTFGGVRDKYELYGFRVVWVIEPAKTGDRPRSPKSNATPKRSGGLGLISLSLFLPPFLSSSCHGGHDGL